jgi:predicted AAA+ superfamily ATPase
VLIDEIQYAPPLLPYIKMAVDSARRPGMFCLTGSQQFIMMRGISESLAARVGILNMLGFSSRERRQHPGGKVFLPSNANAPKAVRKPREKSSRQETWK